MCLLVSAIRGLHIAGKICPARWLHDSPRRPGTVQYLVAQQLAAGGAGSRRGRVGRVGRREGRRRDRDGATLGADLQRGTSGISLTRSQPALLFSQSIHT